MAHLSRALCLSLRLPIRWNVRTSASETSSTCGDRQELVHQDGGLAQRRQPAAHVHLEAGVAGRVGRDQEAEVVDLRLDVVEAAAAAERDLELAGQRRRVRAAQQVARHRVRVGRDVERLVRRHARERAAGDVADGVAAGLARRQADVRAQPQRQLGVLLFDEVKLDVLARGHVPDAAACPLLGDGGERLELLRVGDPLRQLDADHVHALLPLAVGSVDEAERAPFVRRDVAGLEPFEHVDERVDVLLLGEAGAAGVVGNEIDDGVRAHDCPFSCCCTGDCRKIQGQLGGQADDGADDQHPGRAGRRCGHRRARRGRPACRPSGRSGAWRRRRPAPPASPRTSRARSAARRCGRAARGPSARRSSRCRAAS